MQHTRLEKFRQSRGVVVVVVGAYSPVTGNRVGSTAARRVTTLGRRILLLRLAPPLLAVPGPGAGEIPSGSGDAPLPLGGDAPPDKGLLTTPGKGSAGDATPNEGVACVSKALLVRSRIWSTKFCTCGSAETLLAFSWLAGMLAMKSRTPV